MALLSWSVRLARENDDDLRVEMVVHSAPDAEGIIKSLPVALKEGAEAPLAAQASIRPTRSPSVPQRKRGGSRRDPARRRVAALQELSAS